MSTYYVVCEKMQDSILQIGIFLNKNREFKYSEDEIKSLLDHNLTAYRHYNDAIESSLQHDGVPERLFKQTRGPKSPDKWVRPIFTVSLNEDIEGDSQKISKEDIDEVISVTFPECNRKDIDFTSNNLCCFRLK